jgi:hypothetical protein
MRYEPVDGRFLLWTPPPISPNNWYWLTKCTLIVYLKMCDKEYERRSAMVLLTKLPLYIVVNMPFDVAFIPLWEVLIIKSFRSTLYSGRFKVPFRVGSRVAINSCTWVWSFWWPIKINRDDNTSNLVTEWQLPINAILKQVYARVWWPCHALLPGTACSGARSQRARVQMHACIYTISMIDTVRK